MHQLPPPKEEPKIRWDWNFVPCGVELGIGQGGNRKSGWGTFLLRMSSLEWRFRTETVGGSLRNRHVQIVQLIDILVCVTLDRRARQ